MILYMMALSITWIMCVGRKSREDARKVIYHNNGYKIEQYLPALIEAAKAQGYEFVTVSELLLEGSTLIDVNGVQKSAN